MGGGEAIIVASVVPESKFTLAAELIYVTSHARISGC